MSVRRDKWLQFAKELGTSEGVVTLIARRYRWAKDRVVTEQEYKDAAHSVRKKEITNG